LFTLLYIVLAVQSNASKDNNNNISLSDYLMKRWCSFCVFVLKREFMHKLQIFCDIVILGDCNWFLRSQSLFMNSCENTYDCNCNFLEVGTCLWTVVRIHIAEWVKKQCVRVWTVGRVCCLCHKNGKFIQCGGRGSIQTQENCHNYMKNVVFMQVPCK
jgi:hypothetical protein